MDATTLSRPKATWDNYRFTNLIQAHTNSATANYGLTAEYEAVASDGYYSSTSNQVNAFHLESSGYTANGGGLAAGTTVMGWSSSAYTLLTTASSHAAFTSGESGNSVSTSTTFSSSWEFTYEDVYTVSETTSRTGMTTSNVATTTQGWTITGSGRSAGTVTTGIQTTLMSTAYSGTTTNWLGETVTTNFPATTSFSAETFSTESSVATIGEPADYGLSYAANGDWLWKVTNSDGDWASNPQFWTDLAEPVENGTVWGNSYASTVAYAEYIGSGSTVARTILGNETTFTAQTTTTHSDSTISFTWTLGDYLPRETSSATISQTFISSYTASFGEESYTTDALSTATFSSTTLKPFTTMRATVFPHNFGEYTTDEITVLDYSFTTTELVMFPPLFRISDSSAGVGQDYMLQAGVSSTATYERNSILLIDINQQTTNVVKANPEGAFASPSELVGGGDVYNAAKNLRIAGQTIFYPSTNAVYNNGIVPAVEPFSTTDSDSVTWRYSWLASDGDAVLKYTRKSTYLDGDAVRQTMTRSAATLTPVSPVSATLFKHGGAMVGGYQAVKTAAESASYGKRGVEGTIVHEGGSSSTYKTISNGTFSSSISKTVVVEHALGAYRTIAVEGGAYYNLFQFERNRET